MKLKLQYEKTIGDVKKEFHDSFPKFKLEFVGTAEESDQSIATEKKLTDGTCLGSITGVLKEGTIDLEASDKAGEVLHLLNDEYKLPVQLYYKIDSSSWMPITESASFSLGRKEFKHLRPSVADTRRRNILL